MIAAGRVRSFDGRAGRFEVLLAGLTTADVVGVDLLAVSVDLSNPFVVVAGLDPATEVEAGVLLPGRLLHPVPATAIDRRARGLLKGRRCDRFELAGRVLRPVHRHLAALRDPLGEVVASRPARP